MNDRFYPETFNLLYSRQYPTVCLGLRFILLYWQQLQANMAAHLPALTASDLGEAAPYLLYDAVAEDDMLTGGSGQARIWVGIRTILRDILTV